MSKKQDREDQLLSMESFELAKRAAVEGVDDRLLAEANALGDRVNERRGSASPAVAREMEDANLDVRWVKSRCTLPTSTRLHWFLEERNQDKQ